MKPPGRLCALWNRLRGEPPPTRGESLVLGLLAELAARPALADAEDGAFLAELVRAWGNEGWSALHEYARAVVSEARAATGPILECGSGLTTLILGATASPRAQHIISLENSPEWGARTRRHLRLAGLHRVRLHVAPLRSHGESDWYDVPVRGLPPAFHLVVCDGPPGTTRGGRAGLLPAMRGRLAPGCVILLDDAGREHERELGIRWRDELGAECVLCGTDKPYYRLRLPA